MKEVMFVCANVTNVAYNKRVSMRLFYEVRCSSGADNNDDLDRALIISDFQSPDIRGISTNTTQMQCKRFVVPEARYLEGKSSECYASTDTVVLDEEDDKVMSYHTTSPSFNITSDTLNLYVDWQRTEDYIFNTVINLSSITYTDWNGSGIGNIDIKLASILENLEAEKQKSFEGIDFKKMITSEYIKNITASNSTSTLTPHLEYLEDGSLEIELRNVDITKDGWYNVTLYLNSFTQRSTEAFEGIENKTGTFHLDVECPSTGTLNSNLNCSITGYVEDSQTVEKEVDFTCYISDGSSNYSALNFNQMITRTPITLNKSFLVPSTLSQSNSYIVQCHADYYNLGSRRDSFYDTFLIPGTSSSSSGSSSTGWGKETIQEIPGGEEKDSTKTTSPITGGIIGTISLPSAKTIFTAAIILIAIILILHFAIPKTKANYPKIKHYKKTKHFHLDHKILLALVNLLALIIAIAAIIFLIQSFTSLGETSQIIQDPLLQKIIFITFLATITILLFKALNIQINISLNKQNPIEKYWKQKHKD